MRAKPEAIAQAEPRRASSALRELGIMTRIRRPSARKPPTAWPASMSLPHRRSVPIGVAMPAQAAHSARAKTLHLASHGRRACPAVLCRCKAPRREIDPARCVQVTRFLRPQIRANACLTEHALPARYSCNLPRLRRAPSASPVPPAITARAEAHRSLPVRSAPGTTMERALRRVCRGRTARLASPSARKAQRFRTARARRAGAVLLASARTRRSAPPGRAASPALT
jgi:hypothetical protein